MKNIKISDDVHGEIKGISNEKGMTMDGVLRKLLLVEKGQVEEAENHQVEKAESPGSNTVQERNTTTSYLNEVVKAENHQSKILDKNKKEDKKMEKNEVEALIDGALGRLEQKREKKKELDHLGNELKSVKATLGSLEQKFCAPDGSVCFATKQELESYLAAQRKDIADQVDNSLNELKATLGKAEQAKGLAEKAKKPALSPIDERVRMGMSEEESKERDAKVEKVMDAQNITFVDAYRQLRGSPKDYEAVRRHSFQDATREELLTLYESCSLRGDCLEIYSELKARGVNVQGRGEDGEWVDLAEPEKKRREVF